MDFGKGENFAGTFVGSGFVDQGVFLKAVAKFRGLVLIVFGNDSDGFIKTDGDIIVYFFKERGEGHGFKVQGERFKAKGER